MSEEPIVAPGVGTTQRFMPGEVFTWKAVGGAFDIAELAVDAGVRVPEHIHHGHHEAYWILEGSYRFKVGDAVGTASAGAFVLIPPGTPHAWANTGAEPGRVVVVFSPGGMAGYFTELEPLLPALVESMDDLSLVDPAVLTKAEEIMRRYQYELVGPPLT